MLQHLLNTTAIWLLSLLVFDIFLRRESYHSYNRTYLLLTFLLGIFLPVVQWQDTGSIPGSGMARPMATVINAKQSVIQATAIQNTNTIDWMQWMEAIYWSGVIITIILLLKEVVVLRRYFKGGIRSRDGVWRIVETGKQHSPFSVLSYIFISSKNDYDPGELHMILTHEKQHGRSLHFIDTICMEAAKIVFWFHPCVYLFQRRLLILHEYQADAAVDNMPHEYGSFLIRQSMLQTAPSLSHSLNRSPIKNRIFMLTRTSSFKAGFKRLVALPLCIACVFLFTKTAISKNTNEPGGKLYYNGNVFELKPKKLFPDYIMNSAQYNVWLHTTGIPDTITMLNPRTGAFETVPAFIVTYPAKMNGRDIFTIGDFSKNEKDEIARTTVAELNNYLLEKLAPLIKNWDNGYYDLYEYLIVDETGKIVYMHPPQFDADNLTPLTRERMKLLEQELLEATVNAEKKITPARRNGKTEIIRLGRQALQIKNKKATVIEPGC
jgi:hypothetical protein